MLRRIWMAPMLTAALVGCGSGGAHQRSAADSTSAPSSTRSPLPAPVSLTLPARGIAVEVGRHRVLLYALSGRRLGVVAAGIANNTVSLHPWLKDRFGRELALHGGTVTFGDVSGMAPTGNRRTKMPSPPVMAADGHWEMGVPSPSGRWLLGQWSGECEVPIAYVIDTRTEREVGVGRDARGQLPESFALGWEPNDRAVVQFPQGACGPSAGRPGVYTVRPDGSVLRLIVATHRFARAFMWGG